MKKRRVLVEKMQMETKKCEFWWERNANIYECVFLRNAMCGHLFFVVILDFIEVLETLQVIGTYGFHKVRAKP